MSALVAAGVEPDLLTGSSVGALNAAYYATQRSGRYLPACVEQPAKMLPELATDDSFTPKSSRTLWSR